MTFTGTFTALVTPFNKDGSVDYSALRSLVQWQVENGVNGLVPVGTTGESPTLEFQEHIKVINTTVEAASGKAAIIAGTGANSTAEAIELTREILNAGVDATLQVTPYYNKTSQDGLIESFTYIEKRVSTPIILYNVP